MDSKLQVFEGGGRDRVCLARCRRRLGLDGAGKTGNRHVGMRFDEVVAL